MGRADDLDDWYFGDEKGKPATSSRVYEARAARTPDIEQPKSKPPKRAKGQDISAHIGRETASLANRMEVPVDRLPEAALRLARTYAKSAADLEKHQSTPDFISRWISKHASSMDAYEAWASITAALTYPDAGEDEEDDFRTTEGWWCHSERATSAKDAVFILYRVNDKDQKIDFQTFRSRYYKQRAKPQVVERRGWKFEEYIGDDGLLYNRRIGPVTVSAAAEAGVYQLLESTITGKVTTQSLEAATRHANASARMSHYAGREEGVVGPVPAWIQREVKAGREPTFERLIKDLPEGVVYRDDSIIQPTGKPITRGRWRKVVYEAKLRLSRDS